MSGITGPIASLPKSASGQEFKATDKDGNSSETLTFVDFEPNTDSSQLDLAISNLVTSGEEVNNRRQSVNQFFLTINTLLFGGSGWLLSNFLQRLSSSDQIGRLIAAIICD